MPRRRFIRGKIRKDRKTKLLIPRLRPGDIALIAHRDLDMVAAQGLLHGGVKAVINTDRFSTGAFPPEGLRLLLGRGVHLVEGVSEALFDQVREGETVGIREGSIFVRGKEIARGRAVTADDYRKRCHEALQSSAAVVDRFVKNTLDYAYRERRLVTGDFPLPRLLTDLRGRDVVVVVRGQNYREDLKAIKVFIRDKKPVLVGVDGGGDALLECGFRPDLIVGDMDSVSDAALTRAREVVVHAYADGRGIPGKARLERLGIKYHIFEATGTSEDIALLMAYELGAALIVAIGTHTSMIEFLEKGRRGMASTFLVRLKVGHRLVDAKGVSRLYQPPAAAAFLPLVITAGLMPLLALAMLSPSVQHFFRLLFYRLQLAPWIP